MNSPLPSPTAEEAQEPPPLPPQKYASLNARIFAASLDLILIMVVAMPLVQFMIGAIYPEINWYPMIQYLNSPHQPEEILKELWSFMLRERVVERAVFANLVQLAILGAYFVTLWYRYQTTAGKWVLGIEILDDATRTPMSLRQCFKRFFGYIVAGLPLTLGFLWMVFSKKKQGVQDLIAGTVVVVKRKKPRLPEPAAPPPVPPPAA